jgi:hypothetical protein
VSKKNPLRLMLAVNLNFTKAPALWLSLANPCPVKAFACSTKIYDQRCA